MNSSRADSCKVRNKCLTVFLHVLTEGSVPPQKLTTPFIISPARCSPHVSVPEAAPSNPHCCLHSAQPDPASDRSTAKHAHTRVHLPPIINELFCIDTQALDWRQGFGSNHSNRTHTHVHARNLEFLKKNQDLLFIFWCNPKDWWWSWTEMSLRIKVVCCLATLKKTHYMHKYTV